MIYSMSVGMFSMKRANGVSHYIPSTATSAAAQAANAAYRSTLWYSAVGLSRLGWLAFINLLTDGIIIGVKTCNNPFFYAYSY